MKKIALLVFAATVSLFADVPRGVPDKAVEVISNFNSRARQGHTGDAQTLCYVRNGMYMNYKGETYVIDVDYYSCRWSSEYVGGGITKCLNYKDVNKSTRICDCATDGTVYCM